MSPMVCPWWCAYSFDHRLRRLVHDPRKLFADAAGPGSRVLDIGCGMGFFSIGLAGLVGPEGRIFAVDLQQKMLDVLGQRALKAGCSGRIEKRLADEDGRWMSGLEKSLDMALSFWMLHEVPDKPAFLSKIRGLLKEGGRYFVAEPRGHVSRKDFDRSVETVKDSGFDLVRRPRVFFSRAALFATR